MKSSLSPGVFPVKYGLCFSKWLIIPLATRFGCDLRQLYQVEDFLKEKQDQLFDVYNLSKKVDFLPINL